MMQPTCACVLLFLMRNERKLIRLVGSSAQERRNRFRKKALR